MRREKVKSGKWKTGSVARRIVRYGFLFLLLSTFNFQLSTVSAQKYPERREARDGNKAYVDGDFQGAEIHYRRALETNPDFRESLFNLGDAVYKQEKGEEAAKIFSGLAADSLAAPALQSAASFNAGNMMLMGQKIEQAIEFYKQALRIDPTDMQAKYNLAYAKKLLQNPPQNDQNQDKNQDKDQDKNQDQNQDKNDQNQDQQDKDQNKDKNDQGDQEDQNQDNKDGQGDDKQDQDSPPKPDKNGQQEVTIDPQDAEHMLEAMQDEEDKTREKMNAKEVPAVGRSGKNW